MTDYILKINSLRNNLKLEQKFLSDLYKSEGKQTAELIKNAQSSALKCLCEILYCIANGKIPLSGKETSKISEQKLDLLEDNFHILSKSFLSDKEKQIDILIKFHSEYRTFLHQIFNDE